jgi:hypothetical protein
VSSVLLVVPMGMPLYLSGEYESDLPEGTHVERLYSSAVTEPYLQDRPDTQPQPAQPEPLFVDVPLPLEGVADV